MKIRNFRNLQPLDPEPETLYPLGMYRFYLPSLATAPGGSLCLPLDQGHHARSVLRLAPGEPIILFDGRGAWAPAIIAGAPGAKLKEQVLLSLTGAITTDPPPSPVLTIATAVPKADRADWLIEQASQLNVACIQWLDSDRSVVKPKEGTQKMDKWRRHAIESAKQCHRTHLLGINAPASLTALLEAAIAGTLILWLDPAPENSRPVRQVLSNGGEGKGKILALIGPEGGWSPREYAMLSELATENKLVRVHLTGTILRIETAVAALAAIIMTA